MNLEVGQYVKRHDDDRIGKITFVHKYLGEVDVIDSEGDDTNWDLEDIAIIEKEEAEQRVIVLPDFTKDYDAVLSFDKKVLYVGCQEIPFQTIADLYNSIKHAL
jgi:hypothetical protein